MSSKSKLIIGIVLLAVGGGLIPTGILTNNYLRNAVADGVPDALLQIREEAVAEVQEMVPTLATPSVLVGARDEAIAGIAEMIPTLGTPEVLRNLKTGINDSIPDLLNFATSANLLNASFYWAEATYGVGNGAEELFNNPAYTDPYSQIGFSTFAGKDMNYSALAQQILLFYGYQSSTIQTYFSDYGFIGDVPGLIADTSLGLGVGGFLNDWYLADYFNTYGISTTPMNIMMASYDANWTQLGNVFYYLYGWLIPNVVPGAFAAKFGFPLSEAIKYGFYMQWANGTFVPSGIDIGLFMGTSGLMGFEAGVPTPTNIPLPIAIALWDDSNPLSFANDDGILAWVDAATNTATANLLKGAFSLTDIEFLMVLGWLLNFINTLSPTLIEASVGPISELAVSAFYEQWANGTIQGKSVIPEGLLYEISPDFEGPPYLEVGLPDATNISMEATEDLWNDFNPLSFANGDGFDTWLEAADNSTLQALITDEFNITAADFALLVDWLNKFMTAFTVPLLEYGTGYSLAEYSFRLFYEQWANGTMDGSKVLPDGFLSRRDPPIEGPPYFELGLQYPCGLTMEQTENLWLKWDKDSLVTVSGVNKWYQAKEGNAQWNELVDKFGLNKVQMAAITTWLPVFRDTLVNKLAEDDMNLPMEPYDLGNTLFLSLVPAGGVLAALGIVVLILSRRS